MNYRIEWQVKFKSGNEVSCFVMPSQDNYIYVAAMALGIVKEGKVVDSDASLIISIVRIG